MNDSEGREEENDGRREGTRTHRELNSVSFSFRGHLMPALREEHPRELSESKY
jgi:hypothetical protein